MTHHRGMNALVLLVTFAAVFGLELSGDGDAADEWASAVSRVP